MKSESTLNSKQSVAEAAIELVSETRKTTEALDSAHKNVSDIDGQREEQQILVNELLHKRIENKTELDDADRDYSGWIDEKERIDIKLTELLKLRDEPGSLYQFLNDKVEDWRINFGKVLSNDILMNKRLSPEKINSRMDGMFGVSLDLGSLPEKQIDIDNDIASLTSQLSSAASDYNKAESRFKKAGEVHQSAGNSHAESEIELRRIHNQLKSAKDVVQSLIDKSKTEIKAAKVEAEELYDVAKLEHEKAARAIEEFEDSCKEGRKLIESNFKHEVDKSEAAYQEVILKIKDQKEAVNQTRKQALDEVSQELDRKIKGLGIDVELSKSRAGKIKILGSEIIDLTKKATIFSVYSIFIREEYSQLNNLRKKESEADTLYQHEDGVLKSLKKGLFELSESFKVESQQHNNSLTINERELRSFESITNSYEETSTSVRVELKEQWKSIGADKLKVSYVEFNTERRNLRSKLKKQGEPFIKLFSLHQDAVSYQYYISSIESHVQDGQVLAYIDEVCRYYDDGLHQTAIDSLSNSLSILRSIHAYKGALEQFERRIHSFSKRLNSNMDEAIRFKNLTHISLDLKFTPRDIEHWHSIEQLSKSFQQWIGSNDRNKLPSDQVIMAMREFISSMPGDRMGSTIDNLWRHINFEFEIIENNKVRHVSSEKGLNDVSSNGLAYLIMIVTFIGFIDVQRGENKTPLTWSLDELSNIDGGNVEVLLNMLSEKNINMVAACPRLTYIELKRFTNRYRFDAENNKTVIVDLDYIEEKVNPFHEGRIEV